MSHIFTLQIAGIDTGKDDYEDAFYGAGCDDATVAIVNGDLFLDFDRESVSFSDAVQSAMQDVERAGGRVVKVMPAPE